MDDSLKIFKVNFEKVDNQQKKKIISKWNEVKSC